MAVVAPELRLPNRSPSWRWWVCGLLLLATMLNYMDRLTLNLTSKRILEELHLTEVDYGQLESAFAFAFAIGAIIAGWMADRWNVRWIYPAALLAWSVSGFATGLATGFYGLLVCRFFLGLAEAGNWPCALRTTQHVLPPEERAMGNSILQSGAAFGAILTPLIVLALLRGEGTWRYPFLVIGILGVIWVVLWLTRIRREDLEMSHPGQGSSLVRILGILIVLLGIEQTVRYAGFFSTQAILGTKVAVTVVGIATVFLWLQDATRDDTRLPRGTFIRRFWVLATLVVTINLTWHYFRAWLPLFLQNQHGYQEKFTFWFILAYYVFTDLGCLTAGFVTLRLTRWGLSVHGSRLAVFTGCAAVTTLSVAAAFLPTGPLLLGVLLLIGFAALGLFPNYYSFSQEITVRYQGKVTGALGCICWLAMSLLHELVGESIKRTQSYSQGMAVAGLFPLIGVAALVFLWGWERSTIQAPTGKEDAEGNGQADSSVAVGIQEAAGVERVQQG
jgi:ACS family hexuronate transporter-like MFS transporter